MRGLDPAERDEWKAYLTALVQIAGEHTAEVGDALEVMNASMGRMALAEAVEVLDAATDDAEAGLKKSRERRETEVEAAPLARKQAEAESSSEATNQCGDERGNSEDC